MVKRAASFFRDELAASLVEYALILSLLALTCLLGMKLVGTNAQTQFAAAGTAIGATPDTSNGSNGNGDNGNGNNGNGRDH
jgi:Flp pilus assembly pilin Flp